MQSQYHPPANTPTTSNQTQTQPILPLPSYIPKSSQSSILTLPKDFYFKQFALYCSPRGKKTQQSTNYQSNQILISIITSLQQFFQYFSSIKQPSQLPDNSKITLFYKNCKPFWQEWLDSGCLLIKFRDSKQQQEKLLDVIWQFLCYALVGNSIDHDVIGIMLGKREKMTLVEIWLRNNDRAKEIGIQLEEQIRRQLPLSLLTSINSIIRVKHKRHIDSINVHFCQKKGEFDYQGGAKLDESQDWEQARAQQFVLIVFGSVKHKFIQANYDD